MNWGFLLTPAGLVWLPTAADFIWSLPNGMRYRVVVAYRNHRHFEAATTISFADSPAPSPSAPAKSLDGIWRSQGYGGVYLIKGPQLTSFEVTATTCVRGISTAKKAMAVSGREATFQRQEADVYFVRSGDENDHKRLHADGSASDIRIDRLERLPDVCNQATADTPPDNFEVFSRYRKNQPSVMGN
jgi:hypothetical protein